MRWSMPEYQEELALSITDKITLFLDNDESGINVTKIIHKQLFHRVFIKVLPYPQDSNKTQPEHFTKEELIQTLNNKKLNGGEIINDGSQK